MGQTVAAEEDVDACLRFQAVDVLRGFMNEWLYPGSLMVCAPVYTAVAARATRFSILQSEM